MSIDISIKQRAIELRKQGKTYGEILKKIHVAKSTLSTWLRGVGLAKAQKQRITAKRKAAQMKGALARRTTRRKDTLTIYTKATQEIGTLSKREVLLIGVALYWAEGSKEKSKYPSQGIDFGNTDVEMIKLFVQWLQDILLIEPEDISYSLYIHKNHSHRVSEVIEFWKTKAKLPSADITQVYFKKHNPSPKRANTGLDYHGTLRIRVRNSTSLQRQIRGWIYGITGAPCRIV